MPSSQPTTLRDTIARAIWPVSDTQWSNEFFAVDKRDALKQADAVLAALPEFSGRGVEETLEAARLIFGTENIREGMFYGATESDPSWTVLDRTNFKNGLPCVVVSVLGRRATPNPPTETPDGGEVMREFGAHPTDEVPDA